MLDADEKATPKPVSLDSLLCVTPRDFWLFTSHPGSLTSRPTMRNSGQSEMTVHLSWSSTHRHRFHTFLLFSSSVMSDSLWPHGLQHARLPCPSLSLGACSNSCPLSQWCHPTISPSAIPFSSCLQSFPASGAFQWVSSSHQVAKDCSFSLSPSNEYSGLIYFRMDWLNLLAVQETLKSLLQHQSSHIHTWLLEKR